MNEFLAIERQNEIMQKQEIELAHTSRQNKEKVIINQVDLINVVFICLFKVNNIVMFNKQYNKD